METPMADSREVGGERVIRRQHRLFSVCHLASVSFRIFQHPFRVDAADTSAWRQDIG